MKLHFFKYQGTGNDFVLIDQRRRHGLSRTDTALIAQLCDRRFGIGADGLILLQRHKAYDFEMVYFNSDGRESTMCGNGGRCIAAFAHHLGIMDSHSRFLAIDGPHEAAIERNLGPGAEWVNLLMQDVTVIRRDGADFVINTGSPHYVRFVDNADGIDVFGEGRAIRQSGPYAVAGINVNFVCASGAGLRVRTYERGVEDETFSCGTGVVASVLAEHQRSGKGAGAFETRVSILGGELLVKYAFKNGAFCDIWLCGPAVRVFSGSMNI